MALDSTSQVYVFSAARQQESDQRSRLSCTLPGKNQLEQIGRKRLVQFLHRRAGIEHTIAGVAGTEHVEIALQNGERQKCTTIRRRAGGGQSVSLLRQVRPPPHSGWLDQLGRLKGGRGMGLDVARCAS